MTSVNEGAVHSKTNALQEVCSQRNEERLVARGAMWQDSKGGFERKFPESSEVRDGSHGMLQNIDRAQEAEMNGWACEKVKRPEGHRAVDASKGFGDSRNWLGTRLV